MLLYISTKDNDALLMDYIEQQGVYASFLEYDAYSSIKSALVQERAMPTYDYILFHFARLPLPADDLIASVEYIRRYHRARIIIFAPAGSETAELFGRLTDMGLRELVPVSDETNLHDELNECISPDGKGFYNAAVLLADAQVENLQKYVRPKLVIPPDTQLTVGVAGAQERIGATTQAFCMYHALKMLGFTPCVVDTGQTFIEKLTKLYKDEAEIDGSLVEIRGVTFSHDIQVGTGHNAFVLDLGVLSRDNAPKFDECGMRFLCSGAKAWEIPQLIKALSSTAKAAQHIIFSFVAPEDEKEALALLGGRLPGAFAPWRPGLWNPGGAEWHENFMLPLIKEALGI